MHLVGLSRTAILLTSRVALRELILREPFRVCTLGDPLTDSFQVPTVFENYVTDCRVRLPTPQSNIYPSVNILKVDGKSVQLALWDTAGQEDYEVRYSDLLTLEMAH